jgi:hypothetical protein
MKNHQVTIRLETEAGGFVSYGSVPRFLKLPRVAFWGERVFVRAGSTFVLGQWKIVPRYREAFAVAVVDANMPRDRISGGAIMVLPTEARRAAGDGLYYLGNRGFGA